eukprot:CAMPEP_0172500668 /NCGR_PEP_ID=MMETSP1066-20121228/141552_1 /TAXON_ID=671091 /ORGANISM="Coscinodiscus wailesii, Strain CCMP2513" /LENGTH=260 /DNA_ID=CAMNT_0013275013 /DNA_START=76 /DNA_END=855 /DNA_ORIENTATION=+
MITVDQDLPTLISQKNHLAILRHIRTHKLRKPELVLHHGQALLFTPKSLFSPTPNLSPAERLSCLEQLLLSAIDVQNHPLAEKCLSLLRSSPHIDPATSTRYRRLLALCLESAGDTASAEKIYDELSNDNAANLFAMKRKYCLLRGCVGKESAARDALNDYLDANRSDVAAWKEMSELCLEVSDYKGAAYCLEEVVLSDPLNAELHCLLGEVYVSCGTSLNNLKLGRKHMAQSLELKSAQDGNMRGLFGLVSAAGSYLEE